MKLIEKKSVFKKNGKIRKIVCLTATAFCAGIFASCASSKNVAQVSADSYMSEEASENEDSFEDNTEVSSDDEKLSMSSIANKKDKNALESFFTFGNKDNYVYGDEFSLFTNGTFGGIAQKKADFMIAPEKETAGFGSAYMAAYYIVQMNQDSRKKFINAVNSYFSDFENKRLERKRRNTFKKYGKIDVHLDWGTLKSSTPNNADGSVMLGYEFVKKSPYFTITAYPMHNNHWDVVGDAVSIESMALKYYFTKSQAAQLISCLEDEKIVEYLTGYSYDVFTGKETKDEY